MRIMGIQNSHMPETGYIRLWRKAVERLSRSELWCTTWEAQSQRTWSGEVEQPVAEILQQKEQQQAPEVQIDIEQPPAPEGVIEIGDGDGCQGIAP
jgi:hypothetical protein